MVMQSSKGISSTPPDHHQSKRANFDCFTLSMVVPPCRAWLRQKIRVILMHEETIPGITSERSFLHCYNESYEGNFPLVST